MISAFKKELLELLRESEMPDEFLRLHVMKILGPPYPPSKISYEDFLEWANEDTLAEWVNGEVIMTSPASKIHQLLDGFLYSLIHQYVQLRDLGKVLLPPFQMKLKNSGREPDLIFIKKENLKRLKKTYLDGPADLVIEIISPESIGRDRGDKFYEYEQAGIPEYWMLDHSKRRAEFYILDKSGSYILAKIGSEGKFDSKILPGFWIKIEWLWQEPLPSALRILGEIAGIDAEIVERFENALKKK